jgi:hypothetical protein
MKVTESIYNNIKYFYKHPIFESENNGYIWKSNAEEEYYENDDEL